MAQLIVGIIIPLPADVFERAEFLVALKPAIDAMREVGSKTDAVFDIREETSGAAPEREPIPASRKRLGRPTNADKAAAAAALAEALDAQSKDPITSSYQEAE